MVRPRNADGINGKLRSPHHGREARLENTDLATRRSGSFWKDADQPTSLHSFHHVTETRRAGRLLIDWHHMRVFQDPSDQRDAKERITSQEADRAPKGKPHDERVEKALVVGEDECPVLGLKPFISGRSISEPNGKKGLNHDLKRDPDKPAIMWRIRRRLVCCVGHKAFCVRFFVEVGFNLFRLNRQIFVTRQAFGDNIDGKNIRRTGVFVASQGEIPRITVRGIATCMAINKIAGMRQAERGSGIC